MFTNPSGRYNRRPDVSLIVPGLLVGEYPTPEDAEWLRAAHGVTAIISLQDDADIASKGLRVRELEQAYRRHGLGFHRLPVTDCDMEMLAIRLDAIVTLLDELLGGGGCVYLHCNAGMNRAPTAAIAYLHRHHGLSLNAARDLVKARRHCVPYMSVLETRYRIS
jgi:hypothetical protein